MDPHPCASCNLSGVCSIGNMYFAEAFKSAAETWRPVVSVVVHNRRSSITCLFSIRKEKSHSCLSAFHCNTLVQHSTRFSDHVKVGLDYGIRLVYFFFSVLFSLFNCMCER